MSLVLELKCGPYIFEELKDFLVKNNFINQKWNALNILIQNASTVGGIDLGLISNMSKENNIDYFKKMTDGKFDMFIY